MGLKDLRTNQSCCRNGIIQFILTRFPQFFHFCVDKLIFHHKNDLIVVIEFQRTLPYSSTLCFILCSKRSLFHNFIHLIGVQFVSLGIFEKLTRLYWMAGLIRFLLIKLNLPSNATEKVWTESNLQPISTKIPLNSVRCDQIFWNVLTLWVAVPHWSVYILNTQNVMLIYSCVVWLCWITPCIIANSTQPRLSLVCRHTNYCACI